MFRHLNLLPKYSDGDSTPPEYRSLKEVGVSDPCSKSVAIRQTTVGQKNKPSALCPLPSAFRGEQLKDSEPKLITDNCAPFAVPAAAHPSENAVPDAQGAPAGMPPNPKPSIPLSGTGTVENADADQPWKPEPIENPATREQVRELLAGLTKKLSEKLSVPKPAQEQTRARETEISELNLWVRDPILRPEAMRRIMQSERYTVEFDEEGNPISVVEVKQ